MPITTPAEIKARWGFLSEVDDSIMTDQIAIAELMLNENSLGDLYKYCTQLVVVHTFAAGYEHQVNMGYKLKQQEAEVRTSYPALSDVEYWQQTTYGGEYVQIAKIAASKSTNPIAMRVV